jgi:adenosine kinase
MATVGQDFGDYRTWLEAKGVDTSAIREIPDLYTASFFATTDRTNSQIASFYAGAMARAADLSLHELRPRPELVVVSPNDPGAMHKYLDEGAALGVPVFYDPSQQVARVDGAELAHGLAHCDALICNEYEYGLIQKKTGLSDADITRRVRLVVVTLGREGSRLQAEGRTLHIPAVPQERIVDPTGVGDAFRGGFLKGTLCGLDYERCGRLGSLAATYCLEEQGTQNHHFTHAAFLARFEANFGADDKVREILAG